MMIIHYEVYVSEPRGWMLHARYPRAERDGALEEAKELEQINLKVRVVRECYYTDTNAFEEADIYATGKGLQEKTKPAPPRPSARSGPAGARGGASPRKGAPPAHAPPPPRKPVRPLEPSKAPEPPKPPEPPSRVGVVLFRLFAICTLALALAYGAMLLTPEVIVLLWKWGYHIDLMQENYQGILFTVFALVFLMVAVPLSVRYLPKHAEIMIRRRSRPDEAAAAAAAADAERQRKVKQSLDKLASKAMAEGYGEANYDWLDEPLPAAPEPKPEFSLPEIRPDADRELPELLPDPEPEPPQPPAIEKQLYPPEVPPPPEPAAPERGTSPAPDAESHRSSAMRFLGGAVNAVKAVAATLDAYNKFALHLYLAGGVESLCESQHLSDNARSQLTATVLETLGTSPDLARKFHDKLGEYLMEPKYMQVVQAGRNAMDTFLDGRETEAHGDLKGVIREWNRPTAKKPEMVTVMFTDMVGSTDLTQAKGDATAQEVVRRHNSIVRTAIAQCMGREIKHTGDGIMASFPSAGGAVESSVIIMRNVASHNGRTADKSMHLHLRIGLNAGEPIQEEDDLFGATVQLSARVCAATKPDQVLCTGVVKDLALGKGGTFHSVGPHPLKGFKDPIELFEIAWAQSL